MNKFKEHIFNASYLAIFLYGMRRIMYRIRPISFDDAYELVNGLVKRPGEPLFLVHMDGTHYHIANVPENKCTDIIACIASVFKSTKSRQWTKVTAMHRIPDNTDKVVWNMPLTRLLPPELQNRIPTMAQTLRRIYGDAR